MTKFRDALYNMKLGESINANQPTLTQWQWMITRVPGGWIYSCPAGQGHSVFVPYDNGFEIDF
jgi:hypothetical protein